MDPARLASARSRPSGVRGPVLRPAVHAASAIAHCGLHGVDRNFHPEGPARGDLGLLLGRWRYRRDALAPQLPARAAQVASFAKDAPSQSSVAPLQLIRGRPSACFCGSAGMCSRCGSGSGVTGGSVLMPAFVDIFMLIDTGDYRQIWHEF